MLFDVEVDGFIEVEFVKFGVDCLIVELFLLIDGVGLEVV